MILQSLFFKIIFLFIVVIIFDKIFERANINKKIKGFLNINSKKKNVIFHSITCIIFISLISIIFKSYFKSYIISLIKLSVFTIFLLSYLKIDKIINE